LAAGGNPRVKFLLKVQSLGWSSTPLYVFRKFIEGRPGNLAAFFIQGLQWQQPPAGSH
jgi:hypothetical protein